MMAEQAVFMNMCMVCHGSKVLVQDRVKKDWAGIVFPGGHVEPGEPFTDAVIREIREETGLTVSDLQLCGIKQWCEDDVRYVVFLYRTDSFTGELCSSREGKVFWVERSELKNYALASGFSEDLAGFENERITEIFFRKSGEGWKRENK
ncbi:MAG: 8-oxo-dGTP diphosphatase [Clostridia bacterium]|nr:8-oxo-dGTP diphosphatase [Clostridia bacterium]